MVVYTQSQIENAGMSDLRSMSAAIEAHIETMHGGIVRKPYLDCYWSIQAELRERFENVYRQASYSRH